VATPAAEVQMKPIVATTTTEVPMDESSLVATTVEVQMKALVATTATAATVSLVEEVILVQLAIITKLQKQQDNTNDLLLYYYY